MSDPSSAGRVANTGWDVWTPINAVAIGAHIVGSVGQLLGNKERLATQSGVASMSVIKTALTAAALGITGYNDLLRPAYRLRRGRRSFDESWTAVLQTRWPTPTSGSGLVCPA